MKNTKELTHLILSSPELSEEQIYNLASGYSSGPDEAQATIWAIHVLKQNRDALILLVFEEEKV